MGIGLERSLELRAVGDFFADDTDRQVALDPGQMSGVHRAITPRAEALAEAGGDAEVGKGGGHVGGFSCIEGAGTRAHSR